MGSWLDRWAERTAAHDRQVLAYQRELESLRGAVPAAAVRDPSGTEVTIRLVRHNMLVGQGLDRTGT